MSNQSNNAKCINDEHLLCYLFKTNITNKMVSTLDEYNTLNIQVDMHACGQISLTIFMPEIQRQYYIQS